MKHHAPLLLVACTVACGADVPDQPTWFTDVQPLLLANCARCHGADPIDLNVAKYRLDRYVKDDATTFDAFDYAMPIVQHAVDHELPAMPPDYELTSRQREILSRWFAAGAPKGTRENRSPRIELISPLEATTADQSIDTTFRAWDPDLDGLVVQLWAHDLTSGGDYPLGAQTGGGLRQLAIDSGTLASKHEFEIYAVLDDGFADDPALNKTRATLIPSVFIDHGARGTAPTVTLTAPNMGETLIGSTTITWSAEDPDAGDTLTIDLALVQVAADGTEVSATPIASAVANTGSYAWMIPSTIAARDAANAPIPYRIRVTATDTLGVPPNVRSDDSDLVVFVEHPVVTSFTWADVAPLMTRYCAECHGDPARTVALDDFCLLQYARGSDPSQCEATDDGTYERRQDVYQRMSVTKSMPPASAPQPTQAERDLVASWVLGGAPLGTGPVDARPTLTWSAPGNTVLDGTSGSVTLQWTAGDDAGLASEQIEFVKVGAANACSMPNACTSVAWPATPNVITMGALTGTTQQRMFTWMRPSGTGLGAGCYCVRGTVTDSANQSTAVPATRGVRF